MRRRLLSASLDVPIIRVARGVCSASSGKSRYEPRCTASTFPPPDIWSNGSATRFRPLGWRDWDYPLATNMPSSSPLLPRDEYGSVGNVLGRYGGFWTACNWKGRGLPARVRSRCSMALLPPGRLRVQINLVTSISCISKRARNHTSPWSRFPSHTLYPLAYQALFTYFTLLTSLCGENSATNKNPSARSARAMEHHAPTSRPIP